MLVGAPKTEGRKARDNNEARRKKGIGELEMKIVNGLLSEGSEVVGA